jgi:hypothetical protein
MMSKVKSVWLAEDQDDEYSFKPFDWLGIKDDECI